MREIAKNDNFIKEAVFILVFIIVIFFSGYGIGVLSGLADKNELAQIKKTVDTTKSVNKDLVKKLADSKKASDKLKDEIAGIKKESEQRIKEIKKNFNIKIKQVASQNEAIEATIDSLLSVSVEAKGTSKEIIETIRKLEKVFNK